MAKPRRPSQESACLRHGLVMVDLDPLATVCRRLVGFPSAFYRVIDRRVPGRRRGRRRSSRNRLRDILFDGDTGALQRSDGSGFQIGAKGLVGSNRPHDSIQATSANAALTHIWGKSADESRQDRTINDRVGFGHVLT